MKYHFKIPKFPGGDLFDHWQQLYIVGEYTPSSWAYVNCEEVELENFLSKYPLAILTNVRFS